MNFPPSFFVMFIAISVRYTAHSSLLGVWSLKERYLRDRSTLISRSLGRAHPQAIPEGESPNGANIYFEFP
jgi:hypothetical protein